MSKDKIKAWKVSYVVTVIAQGDTKAEAEANGQSLMTLGEADMMAIGDDCSQAPEQCYELVTLKDVKVIPSRTRRSPDDDIFTGESEYE